MLTGKTKETKSAAETIGAAARIADAPAPAVKTEGRQKAAFHYPVVKAFTGKLQYAVNRMAEAQLSHGVVKRGEVFAVRGQKYAFDLVENGDVSHVAAETPLGQPAEYLTGKKQVVPGEPETPTAQDAAGTGTAGAVAPVDSK